MTIFQLSTDRLVDDLRFGARTPDWAVPGEANVVVVTDDGREVSNLPASLAATVIAVGSDDDPVCPNWCDVVANADDVERIAATIHANPVAATSLIQLLRGSEQRSMADGLLLESAVYSALQNGPEFDRWRSTTPRRQRREPNEPAVLVERTGDLCSIWLNRPHVRNALDSRMRDELVEALQLAIVDTSLRVELSGRGSNYSTGGDLDEFGSFTSAASAHLIRTAMAIGPLLAALGDRLTVTIHGACAGSGIEIPAFAERTIGHSDTSIWLPEISLGLIPGAGGTWSIPQRIGRHRTAWLALTGVRIDGSTAQQWGLIGLSQRQMF